MARKSNQPAKYKKFASLEHVMKVAQAERKVIAAAEKWEKAFSYWDSGRDEQYTANVLLSKACTGLRSAVRALRAEKEKRNGK